MPDLGDFAADVLLAYGVSIVLIAGLVAYVVLRARQAKRLLAEVEDG